MERERENDMSAYEKIAAGLQDAIAFAQGDSSRGAAYATPNIKALRGKMKMTQEAFADSLHIPVGTVRDWEQGRRNPEGAAQVLLRMVNTDPQATLELIQRSA
jgi:putative transcriptional regulator